MAEVQTDDDGYILRIPFLCPVCGEGFETKHQRAGHLGGKHGEPRRYKVPIIHGTATGARKHRMPDAEPMCQPCADAWAAYMREYRKRPKAPARKKNYLPPSLERFRR